MIFIDSNQITVSDLRRLIRMLDKHRAVSYRLTESSRPITCSFYHEYALIQEIEKALKIEHYDVYMRSE